MAKLDESVEQKLAGRLEAGIKAWTKVLEGKIYRFYQGQRMILSNPFLG